MIDYMMVVFLGYYGSRREIFKLGLAEGGNSRKIF